MTLSTATSDALGSTGLSLEASTIARAYWSDYLGVSLRELARGTVRIVRHGRELAGYRGVFALATAEAAVLSIPDELPEESLARLTPLETVDPAVLTERLGERAGRVIGPAFVGYAERIESKPAGATRWLGPGDAAAVEALREDCSREEWEHGGGALGPGPSAGAFDGERLAALATYEPWGSSIAHISLVTASGLRGRGHGKSAVSLLARRILGDGLLPQYRTLAGNAPSMRVAAALGFAGFATTLAIRLRDSCSRLAATRAIVQRYLKRCPGEREEHRRLLEFLDSSADWSEAVSRKNPIGHLTASAMVVLRTDGRASSIDSPAASVSPSGRKPLAFRGPKAGDCCEFNSSNRNRHHQCAVCVDFSRPCAS